jgi:hypothetical protein
MQPLSALLTYRVAVGVLAHLLPVETGTSPETLRGHTIKVADQLRDVARIVMLTSVLLVAGFQPGNPGGMWKMRSHNVNAALQ